MAISTASQLAALPATPPDIFGQMSPPPGVATFDTAAGGPDAIGIVYFASNLLQVATIIAGVFVLFQLIMAGYTYITASGDSGAHNKVKDRVTMSFLGLALIVASYTIAGLIGLLFFSDASFILNPKLPSP